MVVGEVNEIVQYAKTLEDVDKEEDNYYGEHLFFELKNMDKDILENTCISLKVQNKSIFKNEPIGQFEFSFTKAYNYPNHTIFHNWIGLINPLSDDVEDATAITGYMKISMNIQGPGDQAQQLNDMVGLDKCEENIVIMPESIRKQFKQLKIRFARAEHLPKMDTFGTIDAYVYTKFLGQKVLKTKPVT